jgi:hypothetical protein
LAVDSVDARQGMFFVQSALQRPDCLGFPFELCFDRAVGMIADKPSDSERAGPISHELPEAHSLHPADEPEPNPYRRHARVTPDVK